MAAPLLTLQAIDHRFGSKPLLAGAELLIGAGERIALVGRNGSGKSTLLKIAAGLIEPDEGKRFVKPGASLRYLPQEPDFSGFSTVQDYVDDGLQDGDHHHRGVLLVTELGLRGDEDPATLSGGEARRAAIAKVLAPQPDIILLDEPTNHLDLPAIEWLEAELKAMSSSLVMISHDRRFLDTLSRTTVWLERGEIRRREIGFDGFEAWRDEVLEEEQRENHKLERKIAREEDWLRYGVTARRKRNVRRLGELHALREKRRTLSHAQGSVSLNAGEAEKSGKLVIEAKGISKFYGDATIIKPMDMRIARGDRIGIAGPNGAGKTTLINLLTGQLPPDTGSVKLGTQLELISLEQARDSLNPEWSLREAMTGSGSDQVVVNGEARHVMSYMKDFLFSPEQANTPIKVLSGGERGRLMLARALAKSSNLMVLDEPTNDLDLETLDMLQDMLATYQGTVIIVSHDRDFLDRVVTSLLFYEGNGDWVDYAGGYSDMLAQRKNLAVAEKRQSKAVKSKAGVKSAEAAISQTGGVKRKMTFKDKHALETLPGEMAGLESQASELESQLADGGFYGRDPDGFARASEELVKVRQRLSQAEERWLELEMQREELEG